MWTTEELRNKVGTKGLRVRHRRGDVVRVVRGVYGEYPPDDDDRLAAIFRRLPDSAMLTGPTAARRMGIAAPEDGRVHVRLPPGVSKPVIPGVFVHEEVLEIPDPILVRGMPCVPPIRCAVDLARRLPRMDALPVLDSVLHRGLADHDELLAEVHRHRGLRGVRQLRDLVRLADAGAECVPESQLRLILIDGRLPVPETQIQVFDAGVERYRLDMGYRRGRIGIEYDGRSHLDLTMLAYDRARANWLSEEGWRMRHFTAPDLYRRPSYVVATVRAALGLR